MTAGRIRRPWRGRASLGALVLALFGASAFPGALGAQVAVDELEVHVQLRAGSGEVTRVIPVRNEQDRVQQVRVVLNDWQRDTLGRNEFLPAGRHPRSCGERISVFPATFQLAPGATENVRVTYAPSADLAGCWSIVMFETPRPPAQDRGEGSFLTIEMRTGVKVYVHAANPVRAGEILFADVVEAWVPKQVPPGAPRDSSRAWQADVRFRSTGSEHLILKTTVEIRDLDGLLLAKATAPDAYLTPDGVRDLRVTLPALTAGAYVALVMVDYGGDEITAAQVEFKVP